MSAEPYLYPGGELDLFVHARRWKAYWASQLPPLTGDVLEVGAGLAANTPLLLGPQVRSWTCLEPDRGLLGRLRATLAAAPALARCRAVEGTVAELDPALRFDAILYIDVLEHIEDDRQELRDAAARLRPGGLLIVLAPAHQWLFTEFDRAIGHFRRYSRASLAPLAPDGLRLRRLYYLDAVGMLASASNRLVLKSAMPTMGQVRLWDRVLVPLSTVVDRLTGHRLGRSVVAVWQRAEEDGAHLTRM